MNFQDLFYFTKVVEKGSLIAAARYLDIPTSTLSRRLQAFEQQLGYKLVHRSSKSSVLRSPVNAFTAAFLR